MFEQVVVGKERISGRVQQRGEVEKEQEGQRSRME
jgi:hypothetical protein